MLRSPLRSRLPVPGASPDGGPVRPRCRPRANWRASNPLRIPAKSAARAPPSARPGRARPGCRPAHGPRPHRIGHRSAPERRPGARQPRSAPPWRAISAPWRAPVRLHGRAAPCRCPLRAASTSMSASWQPFSRSAARHQCRSAPRCAVAGVSRPGPAAWKSPIDRPRGDAQGPPAAPRPPPLSSRTPAARGGTHRYPRPCAEFSERRVVSEIRLERGAARRQPECRAPETLERVESMRGIKRSLLRRSFSGGCRPTIPELPSNYPRVAVQPLLDCRPTTLWATACSPETSSKSALPVVVRRIVGPVRGRCVRPPRNSVRTAEP